jgi:hypothetical protein
VIALLLAAGALANATSISISVSPKTVKRGHDVVVSGGAGSCPAGDSVTLISHAFAPTHSFAGVPAVFAKVKGGGKFRTTAHVPKTRAPGKYTISGRCGGGNLGVSAKLTVTR